MVERNNKRIHFTDTDFPIPKFNFKQAVLLLFTLFVLFISGSILIENAPVQYAIPIMFVTAVLIGASVASIQFYKQKGIKKAAIVVGTIFFILAFIMFVSLYFGNVLV